MDEDRASAGELVKSSSAEWLPGGARVVLKQLFSGQMGLTFVASYQFGMAVGVPLDLHTGWDATTKDGLRRMHRELLQEDPSAWLFHIRVHRFVRGPDSTWHEVERQPTP